MNRVTAKSATSVADMSSSAEAPVRESADQRSHAESGDRDDLAASCGSVEQQLQVADEALAEQVQCWLRPS